MNEPDRERAADFARLLLGKRADAVKLGELLVRCGSFEEFRIQLVLEFEALVPEARVVAERWRERVRDKRTRSDGNDLMHTAELLALRHEELSQKLTRSTADMLEKLRAIDSLATVQADLRNRVAEMGDLIEEFRDRARRVEQSDKAGTEAKP